MWEANSRNGTAHPHAMEVVDIETGAVQYITSGSHIKFVEGEITDIRTQEAYNKMSAARKDLSVRKSRKGSSKTNKSQGV